MRQIWQLDFICLEINVYAAGSSCESVAVTGGGDGCREDDSSTEHDAAENIGGAVTCRARVVVAQTPTTANSRGGAKGRNGRH